MSKALGMRCVWGLCGVLLGVFAFASVMRAEVSTDVSGSVLVYPKVVWTGPSTNPNLQQRRQLERDTVIQISNTSNNMVHAHCFYVNAQLIGGQPIWQITDFAIWLSRQQPTHWVASQGRPVNPADERGSDGSGLDPGAIPPVPPGFEGELKCVQVDASGTPFGGNNLKGEEVIRSADGDVSKANALAILANPDLAGADPANELRLDNSVLNNGEYNACPNTWLLNHFADGASDPVVATFDPVWCGRADSDECPIRTYLTVVPCSQDFENAIPSSVTMQFAIVNEFENVFSTSTTVDCWRTFRLADVDAPTGFCSDVDVGPRVSCTTDQQCIDRGVGFCEKSSQFGIGTLGTTTAFTRITPADLPPDLQGGIMTYAEEVHYNSLDVEPTDPIPSNSHRAWAAWNPQNTGNRFDATIDLPGGPVVDTITIPGF
jgi:hypothetical protein